MEKRLIDTLIDTIDESSGEEILNLIKDLKSYLKDRKTEIKDSVIAEAKASIKEDDEVFVTYKDEKISGIVTRVGKKSFTIKADVDGEIKKIPRQFHLYIGHVE